MEHVYLHYNYSLYFPLRVNPGYMEFSSYFIPTAQNLKSGLINMREKAPSSKIHSKSCASMGNWPEVFQSKASYIILADLECSQSHCILNDSKTDD